MLNARTQTKHDLQTAAQAKVTFLSVKDRRWVALVVDAAVSAGSALLEVVSIDTANGNAETVHWSRPVTAAAPAVLPLGPSGGLRGLANQDLVVRLASAGGGNTGYVNVLACPE